MGVVVDTQNDGGAAKGYKGLKSFIRRKHVDSVIIKRQSSQQLAKKLSVIDLIAIGNFHNLLNFELGLYSLVLF